MQPRQLQLGDKLGAGGETGVIARASGRDSMGDVGEAAMRIWLTFGMDGIL